MAQMDPVATKTASSGNFQDYPSYARALATDSSAPVEAPRPTQTSTPPGASLLGALERAADRTAETIAQGTKQTNLEVRARLSEVVQWLVASLRTKGNDTAPCPPVTRRPAAA